ncbi:MAG: hypothetical protein AAFV95_26260 [Bacteroidota bacterium]
MSPSKKSPDKGNIYDRILKENAEAIFLPLLEQELGFRIRSHKAIGTKLSKTLEREMDLVYQLEMEDGAVSLLHIEFQTKRDPQMLYRMAEYHGLMLRKYRLPIRHVVIYLGTGTFRTARQLNEEEVFSRYDVLNIHKIDPMQLLESQVPELVVLALLAELKKEQIEPTLYLIIQKLRDICSSNSELSRYLTQLTLLARLRKLELLTTKLIEDMPILYDIEEDTLYQTGFAKGEQTGEGNERFKRIKAMLINTSFTPQQIAAFLDLPLEEVLAVQKQLNQ